MPTRRFLPNERTSRRHRAQASKLRMRRPNLPNELSAVGFPEAAAHRTAHP
jgi:hypothetical protein